MKLWCGVHIVNWPRRNQTENPIRLKLLVTGAQISKTQQQCEMGGMPTLPGDKTLFISILANVVFPSSVYGNRHGEHFVRTRAH